MESTTVNKRNVITEGANEPEKWKSLTNLDPTCRKRNGLGRIRSNTFTNLQDHFNSGKRAAPYKWWSSGNSLFSLKAVSSINPTCKMKAIQFAVNLIRKEFGNR